VDRLDIDDGHLVGERRLARQAQRLGGEGRIARRVGERVPHRRDEIGSSGGKGLTRAPQRHPLEQHRDRGALPGVPARDRVGVVDREELQPVERYALAA
jgi:hypothetical protein